MLGSTQLYDGSLSGDHTDFLIGIVLVLVGFLGLLYERYFVVDDNDENDHQDHGIGTSDDHVIINIKELAGVNPSVLLRSIPVVDFNSRNARDGVKCAVCLFELADGDKAKILPAVNIGFTLVASTRGLSRTLLVLYAEREYVCCKLTSRAP